MTILRQIQEREACEHVHEVYEQLQSRYGGFLPDSSKAFANNPEYLRATVRFSTPRRGVSALIA